MPGDFTITHPLNSQVRPISDSCFDVPALAPLDELSPEEREAFTADLHQHLLITRAAVHQHLHYCLIKLKEESTRRGAEEGIDRRVVEEEIAQRFVAVGVAVNDLSPEKSIEQNITSEVDEIRVQKAN